SIDTIGSQHYWGTRGGAYLVLRYRDEGCTQRPSGGFEAFIDGTPAQVLYLVGNRNSCVDGVGTRVVYAYGSYPSEVLDIGRHIITARYLGGPGFAPVEARSTFDVIPQFIGAAPGGSVSLGLMDPGTGASICPAESRHFGISTMPDALPPPLRFQFGVVNF